MPVEELNELQRFAKLKLEEFAGLAVDQKIALICVWAVHHERVEQARILSELQGCRLTEDDVYEVAFFFRKVWQIDVPRENRSRCFLCKTALPSHFERLCRCFRVAQVAVYTPPTPQNVPWLKKEYPEDWYDHVMETILCQNCGDTAEVTAGVVASKFRKGRSVWRSPKFCQSCFKEKQQFQRSQKETRARPLPTQKRNSVEEKKITLQELQDKIVQISPPPVES